MEYKLKQKKCQKEQLINNSIINSNNIYNNNINKTDNNSNYHPFSASKKIEDNYINSKGNYSNIICIPPPYDSINKSLIGGSK